MERRICGHDKEGEEDALIAILKSLVGECKAVYANKGEQIETSSNKTNEVHGVSFEEYDIQYEEGGILGALPCQLPPKELNPRSFTLPYTIGSLNLYAMVDLGASVIIMPKLIFEHLRLANHKETDMLVVRADMTEKALLGIVENVLVKINKFLFPSDFMIMDTLGEPNEIIILRRLFLATLLAQIDVFREISLGFGEDRVLFNMDGNVCHSNILVEKVYMTNSIQNEEPFNPLEIDTVDSSNDMQEPEVEHKEVDNLEKITSRWHDHERQSVNENRMIFTDFLKEQYLALTHGNPAPCMVKPEIGGNVNFEIKSQFMRELREDTLSGNKNDDAREHVERILDIVSLFNILRVSHDAIMLCVFHITLTRAMKRWVERLPSGIINTCDCSSSLSLKGDHLQKWHDGSSSRRASNGSLDGIATIANKLDSLGRDMKKLKENVHVIQVGCETFRGSHLDKECPLRPPRYYTRMDNQPLSGERKLSLTEFITKYMEESAKKEVKALTREVEGRTTGTKIGECKAIFTKDGLPLYTPFYYSTEEIEYFYVNSSFSDEETQEEIEEVEEIEEAVAHHGPTPRKVIPSELSIVSYYVAPYEPSIPFARLLQQHAEEALVHKTMESLKESRTLENEDVKMSTECSAILQNELPLIKQDPRSFILPYSIGILTFNALADLGASVSIMPLSMFKRLVYFVILDMVEDLRIPIILGRPLLATAHAKIDIHRKLISLDLGNQKVVFKTKNNPNKTLIESVCAIRNEKSITDDDLMKIDHELKKCYWGCLNDDKRLDVAWEGMSFEDWVRVSHGKVCEMTKERILKDYWRREPDQEETININQKFNPTQEENTKTEEDCEDLENFGEKKIELILDAVLDKLDDDWFTGIINDEDNLDRMVVYMELKSHDDFIDINDEAYKERMCKLLGMTYKKPSPILVEKVEVTRYTIGLGESYTKVRILGIEEMPRTNANVAAVRAELMEEVDIGGSVQRETFLQQGDGNRDHLGLWLSE
ncbi:phospholipase-like protein [Tanacetum coccineum]